MATEIESLQNTIEHLDGTISDLNEKIGKLIGLINSDEIKATIKNIEKRVGEIESNTK